MSTSQFSWAFEHKYNRSKQWYICTTTLILTVIVVSFILGAYLLGIVCIIFVGVYLLYEVNSHPMVNVNITDTGIALDDQEYRYGNLLGFGIIDIVGSPSILRLLNNHRVIRSIDIFIDPAIDHELLRSYLGQFMPENPSLELAMVDRILLSLKL